MNDPKVQRSVTPRFSLANLLTLTALIALITACALAYRKNRAMVQELDGLQALSSRLYVDSDDELASSEMPQVADDFRSWNIHIPDEKNYELRLGIGAVSENGIPPVVSSVPIPAGQHRVTLYFGDFPSKEFRYVVYVDGKQAIEQTMGSDWIPGGWSSASGLNWPRELATSTAALQLAGRSYEPKLDFGKRHYFNGQSDDYVTRQGFRLWLDQPNRAYPPASPFVGFARGRRHLGIGLRDGLRYKSDSRSPYEWTFTRPNLRTNEPVLRVSAEFFARDGTILSNLTPSFPSWQLFNDARGEHALSWQADSAKSNYSAFLKAKVESDAAPRPTVELRWDASRPDEIGLRTADTPANDQISRWRLRILDGTKHLWRELRLGERTMNATKAIDSDMTKSSDGKLTLDLEDVAAADTHLRWQTDESLPLQILERTQRNYAGMGLYEGLPVTLAVQIPRELKPALSVSLVDEAPDASDSAFPGGAVFDEIQINLEAVGHEWIWLRAKPMQ